MVTPRHGLEWKVKNRTVARILPKKLQGKAGYEGLNGTGTRKTFALVRTNKQFNLVWPPVSADVCILNATIATCWLGTGFV